MKELKYTRRSVDEEWFTLEPDSEPEHYLTWKVKEFVFESKYQITFKIGISGRISDPNDNFGH